MLKANVSSWLDDVAAANGNMAKVFAMQGTRAIMEGTQAANAFSDSAASLSAELATSTSNMERYGAGNSEAHDMVVQTDDAIAALAAALGVEAVAVEAVTKAKTSDTDARREAEAAIKAETEAIKAQDAERKRVTAMAMNASMTQTTEFVGSVAAETELAAGEASDLADEIGMRLDDVMATRMNPVGAGLSQIAGGVTALLGPIGAAVTAVVQLPALLGNLTATVQQLPETLVAIPELATALIDAIVQLPAELVKALPEIFVGLGDLVVSSFLAGFNIVTEAIGLLPGRIADSLANVLREIASQINPFDGDGAFLGTDLGAGKGEKKILGVSVPFFETGGDVTRTGLAYVHEGERVLSVDERQSSMGGGRPVNVSVVASDPRVVVAEIRGALGGYGSGLSMIGGF
jgi:hypothetical protein